MAFKFTDPRPKLIYLELRVCEEEFYEQFFQKTTTFLVRNTCCEQTQYCLRAFLERSGFKVFKEMRSDSPLKLLDF